MSESENPDVADAAGKSEVRLERLYLKDASFESPGTPAVFAEPWQPELKVDINSRANPVQENVHEVVLSVTVRAKRTNGKTAFVVEVQQAGVFMIDGVNPEVRHQVLGVLCPNTLFPYLREAVDSLVVKGGFPALHLAPVNFEALYREAMRQKATRTAENAPPPDVTH